MRRTFWAVKTIKNLFMEHYAIWLIRKRRTAEEKRQLQERETSEHMGDRAHLYLRKLLSTRDGKIMLWTYLREVKDRWMDKNNQRFVFPDKDLMPEIGMKWTVRGKSMHILRHRVSFEVTEWAKANFRESNPPLYVCNKCDEKFFLKAIAREHKMRCAIRINVPEYLSWRIAQPLVDEALGPLVTHFYRQKNEKEAAREERQAEIRMRSDELMNQALVGTKEKPRHDEIKKQSRPRTKLKTY
jgi:hypothetical protein